MFVPQPSMAFCASQKLCLHTQRWSGVQLSRKVSRGMYTYSAVGEIGSTALAIDVS